MITQQPASEASIGNVRVVASMLNLRREASADSEIVSRVRRGEGLAVLEDRGEWLRVRTGGGEIGWVSARYVARDGAAAPARSRRGCPPDSDFTFVTAPRPSFAESGPHGIVTVEANVDARGNVTATKVVSNTTGDDTAARTAEAEIRAAKFAPPVKNCVARAFVFVYRRAF